MQADQAQPPTAEPNLPHGAAWKGVSPSSRPLLSLLLPQGLCPSTGKGAMPCHLAPTVPQRVLGRQRLQELLPAGQAEQGAQLHREQKEILGSQRRMGQHQPQPTVSLWGWHVQSLRALGCSWH